jgi:hypothetical protein
MAERVLGARGWLRAGTWGYFMARGAVWWLWGLGWGPGGMGVPYAQGKGHLEA